MIGTSYDEDDDNDGNDNIGDCNFTNDDDHCDAVHTRLIVPTTSYTATTATATVTTQPMMPQAPIFLIRKKEEEQEE